MQTSAGNESELNLIADELQEILQDIQDGKIDVSGGIDIGPYLEQKRQEKRKRQLEKDLENISVTRAVKEEENNRQEGEVDRVSSTVSGSFDSKQNCRESDCSTTKRSGRTKPPRLVVTPINDTILRYNHSNLTDGLFPVLKHRTPAIHDPSWPGMSACLQFHRYLSSWEKVTSTMIDPGTRSVRCVGVCEERSNGLCDRQVCVCVRACVHVCEEVYERLSLRGVVCVI